MITLSLSSENLLLIIGTKEAQIFQHGLMIDELIHKNRLLNHDLITSEQKNSELLKDRDMDQLELNDLKSKIARMIMTAEKV